MQNSLPDRGKTYRVNPRCEASV